VLLLMPEAANLPDARVTRAVARDIALPGDFPSEKRAPSLSCTPAMTASLREAAVVRLDIDANCRPNARFTLHHSGMVVSALTDDDGRARIDVPALNRSAVFIASFDDGMGAVATAQVADLARYDRYVVQWRGDAHSLRLYAPGHGADAGQPGDVRADRTRDPADGFVMRLGGDVPGTAQRAEVYTFSADAAARDGSAVLRLAAEVTEQNCGRDLAAEGISTAREGAGLRLRDLVLSMPDCDALGERVLVKTLFNDLNIAQR